jgi:hypothetical protein
MSETFDVAACVRLMKMVDEAIRDNLRKDRAAIPEYTVSGGALRDTLLGRPVADIDVCVRRTDIFGADTAKQTTGEDYTFGAVEAVCDPGIEVDGYPIQLIQRTEKVGLAPLQIAQYHQVFLSDVFWRQGCLHVTRGFVEDAGAKVIRVKDTGRSRESIKKYLNKVRQKYDWPIREPDVEEWLS